MTRQRPVLPVLFSFLLSIITLQGCVQEVPQPKRLKVVASIEPLAYFVERIGGDRVLVSVMVPPGANPHSYDPTPKQMVQLGEAALFVKAGSGVEFELNWMDRFLELNRNLKVCDASAGVALIPVSPADSLDAAPREVQGQPMSDPHYWLSVRNARVIAANVEQALAALDPGNRARYAANRAALDTQLRSLDIDIRRKLSGSSGRSFLVFHPAWGYFAKDYGLVQIAAEEEGKTLTPVQMERIIGRARAERIKTIFVAPQYSTAQASAIARDIGGTTVVADPLSREYQANLMRVAEVISRSMQ